MNYKDYAGVNSVKLNMNYQLRCSTDHDLWVIDDHVCIVTSAAKKMSYKTYQS